MIPQNTKLHLKFIQSKDWKHFFFSLGDICVFPPLLVKLCLLTRKTEMKKEKETFTTTSSLKFQSNAFCSCDTIKRLEFFFFFNCECDNVRAEDIVLKWCFC